MNEFIEKLIGRLEEIKSDNFASAVVNEPYSMGICHTIEKSIKIVNQLAEEYNNGWIPCSERLPDIGERVFVWVYGRVCIGKRIDAKLFEEYDIFSLENGSNESTKRIDAWQPLPARYQPKGE